MEVRGQGRVSTQRLGGRGGLLCLGDSQSVKGERWKLWLLGKKLIKKRLALFPTGLCHLKKALGSPNSSGWAASLIGRWLRHINVSPREGPYPGPPPPASGCRSFLYPVPSRGPIPRHNHMQNAIRPLSSDSQCRHHK